MVSPSMLRLAASCSLTRSTFTIVAVVLQGPGEGKEHVDLSQYGANLAEIYRRLATKGKNLIWTTTTPCPNVRLVQSIIKIM